MSRIPRIISYTDVYHVILRSINQQILFEDELDYEKFLYILDDCRKKYSFDIFAYCLMDNHVHILLKSDFDTMSKVIHLLYRLPTFLFTLP